MTSKTFSYIRVSSKDQNEQRQIDTMLALGVQERDLFIDKLSGKDTNRPKYQALKQVVRTGDTIIIDSITRLSRNMEDIKAEYQYYVTNGISLQFVKEPMLNTKSHDDIMQKAISDIILTLLSAFAEKERNDIKQRQAEGIKSAKNKGVKFGRPSLDLPANWNEEYSNWKEKKQTAVQFATNVEMTKPTLYRKIKEYELQQG